ncbi:TetR family transcriptional regulator [Ktedonobacter sp. SOSP1-52]|uniref:TetR/AcrR family transcriptional regulator n=1 Tax=Ktedonobacter sp. SOSP1-52 TaxID=2778366 RepID=UPI001915F1A4|nr:TetR/AcrR family transcriptional regulator [Ktedonobacter sp. SOSP1-52]GHO66329.1 TetR family transcriptional regulator [Ktedonobacter sp. SOSP1-52]
MARTPKVVEDRREQLLDAAIRVFARKGFSRATNKDIAHEADVTPGLIYHYFESKEALLQAVLEERSPLSLLRSLPAQVMELPPAQFLPSLVLRVLKIVEGEQFVQIIRVILPELMHNPSILPVAPSVLQRAVNTLAAYLDQQMQQGKLRRVEDSRLAAQTLMGSVIGFVLRRQIFLDSQALAYSQEQVANTIADIFLQGLLPD